MLRWNAVLLLFFIAAAPLLAGEPVYVPHGAAEMGVSFASSASSGHWSCFHNQALLTSRPATSAALALETRFMMAPLSSKAVSVILAGKTLPLGLIITHYGNSDYYRIFTGAGSAVTLAKGVSLGVQVDYITEKSTGDYRDLSHLTFETGITVSLSSSLTLGIHIFNPLASVNTLPSSINMGLEWKHTEDLSVVIETGKVTDEPLSVQGGISWTLLDKLILRSGYMSSPSCFSFGLGYAYGSLQTDAGFMVNSVTGVTSSVSFIWNIRGK
ncbi:MAG TPA: hypothetical protein VN276_04155 [Bacteroidales bacterium]|nr:hypothetical protein [Bacteroidales bacterium]